MVGQYIVAGTDEQQTLDEALRRLHLPREAVEYEVENESEDELLPGAKPQLKLHIRIRAEYLGEHARQHVENLLRIMEIEAVVTQEIIASIVFVRIASTEAASLLIGKDGQNLDAMQYLVNRMILRSGREAPMVVIDVENYRQRQFDALERLANRAAARARETGNEIELDPMPALERKYLHHYLREMPGVRTFSRGDEPERYIVILAD
jgi:spoIIIJ-associated protein